MDIDDPFSGFPMGMGGFTNMNFGRLPPCPRAHPKETRSPRHP